MERKSTVPGLSRGWWAVVPWQSHSTDSEKATNQFTMPNGSRSDKMRKDGLVVKALNGDWRDLGSVPASTSLSACYALGLLIFGPLVPICVCAGVMTIFVVCLNCVISLGQGLCVFMQCLSWLGPPLQECLRMEVLGSSEAPATGSL